jgi:cation transport ATPase
LLAGCGLITGLAARFAFAAPQVGRTIFLVTLVVAGTPLVVQTIRGMARGRFAADIVATLAIVTALCIGQYFAGVVIV